MDKLHYQVAQDLENPPFKSCPSPDQLSREAPPPTAVVPSPTHYSSRDLVKRATSIWRREADRVCIKLENLGHALLWLLRVASGLLFLGLGLPIIIVEAVYDKWIVESVMGIASERENEDEDDYNYFGRIRSCETTKDRLNRLRVVILVRLGTLLLLWLPLTLFVPNLKKLTVLGSPFWKWTLLGITLTWFPTVAELLLYITSDRDEIGKKRMSKTLYRGPYYIIGLTDSLTGTLSLGLVLAVWLVYFRTDHGLKSNLSPDTDNVLRFGTCTLVSLLVGAILWVAKTTLLLKWKADAIYGRFRSNILVAGFQLYFLALITDKIRSKPSLKACCVKASLIPWWDGKVPKDQDPAGEDDNDNSNTHLQNRGYDTKPEEREDGKLNFSKRNNLRIKDCTLKQRVTLSHLKRPARFLTSLARVTTREDDGTPEVEKTWRKKTHQHVGNLEDKMTKDNRQTVFGLGDDEAQVLYAELGALCHSGEEITYAKLIKWMVDSHKNCLTVGYTLVDSEAVADTLDIVMVLLIVIVVIFLWLLMTGLATTKILLLIASPVLAFSFVFADTAKTFFQGIIFSFVTHPFDVGDRCIIDETEMEVKRIGILSTTFKKLGSKEHLLYQNSQLATKCISNLQGQPDPDDEMELELGCDASWTQIEELKKKINEFLKKHKNLFEPSHLVIVKAIGGTIRVAIQFTHKMSNDEVTHSQYHRKKTEQRSLFLSHILGMPEDQPSAKTPS